MSEGPAHGPISGAVDDLSFTNVDRTVVVGAAQQIAVAFEGLRTAPLRAPFAKLDVRLARLRERPSLLLRSEFCVTPLWFRDDERRALQAWCDAPDPFAVYGIAGEGGAGKTRLAVDLAYRLAAARSAWTVGVLVREAYGDEQALQSVADLSGDVLVIVDYAEAAESAIGRLVELSTSRAPDRGRLRLLVVGRVPADNKFWFRFERSGPARALLLAAPLPIGLNSANQALSEDDRQTICQALARAFAIQLEEDEDAVTPVPSVADSSFANLLALSGRALLHVLDPTGRRDSASAVWHELADREERAWRSEAQRMEIRMSAPAARRLAALMSLAPPADKASGARLMDASTPGLTPPDRTDALALAARVSPGDDGALVGPVRPDPLAEYLIAELLADDGELPDRVLALADVPLAARMVNALTRTHQSVPSAQPGIQAIAERITPALAELVEAGVEPAAILDDPVGQFIRVASPPPTVLALWRSLPSYVLGSSTALALTERVAGGLFARRDENADRLEAFAHSLSHYGLRLNDVGRFTEALQAAERVVALLRLLSATDERHLPRLATNLSRLATQLAAVGRAADALHAEREATAFRWALSIHDRPLRKDFARGLTNLGHHLASNGQHSEALSVTQQARAIEREILGDDADDLAERAETLSNLGNRLATAGRDPEALEVTRESVEIWRSLATDNPAYSASLAVSLFNLAIRLGATARHQAALEAAREAADIYRALARGNPGNRPDLADALSNLGNRLMIAGQLEDAVAASREAVDIYRELVTSNPGHRPRFANALSDLGIHLAEVKRHDEALTVTHEAVAIYQPLAAANPGHWWMYAKCMSNLGSRLGETGRNADAIAAERHAVELRRRLVAENEGYLPDLVNSLMNLIAHLTTAGERGEEAVGLRNEAVVALSALAEANPLYLALAIDWLRTASHELADLGHEADGLRAAGESVRLARAAQTDRDHTWRQALAASLSALADRTEAAGDPALAQEQRREASSFAVR